MRKKILMALVSCMMTSLTVSAQCDTRKEVINTYRPQIKHTYTSDIDTHVIERIGNGNTNGFNTTVVVPVTTYRSGISYQDYDFISERLVGYACNDSTNTVTNTGGNDLLKSMFENGVSNDDRVKLIDTNIVGVGKKTAEALLWYFTHEDTPRNWEDFSGMVEKAIANQEEKGASHQLITALKNIIIKNKSENQSILGLEEQAVASSTAGSSCQNPVAICREYSDRGVKTVHLGRELYSAKDVKVTLGVSGVDLLSREKEVFHVTVNRESGLPVVNVSSKFGEYSITNVRENYRDEFIVELEGNRKRIAPNYNNFDIELSLDQNTNEAIVTIIDKNFSRNSGTKTINLNVNSLKWSNSIVHTGEYELSKTGVSTVIRTGKRVPYSKGGLRRNETYNVSSSLRVIDSNFFNETKVNLSNSSVVTATVK
jgi:hypothetical protein